MYHIVHHKKIIMKNNIFQQDTTLRVEESLFFLRQGSSIGETGPLPKRDELNFFDFETRETKDVYVKKHLEFLKDLPYPDYFVEFRLERKFFWPEESGRSQKVLHEEKETQCIYVFDCFDPKRDRIEITTCPFESLKNSGNPWYKELYDKYKGKSNMNICLFFYDVSDRRTYAYFANEIIFASTL